MKISLAKEYSKCLSLFSILIHMLLVIYFTSIISHFEGNNIFKKKEIKVGGSLAIDYEKIFFEIAYADKSS